MVVTRSAAKNRAKLVRERKNVAGCLTTEMMRTGMIESRESGMRMVMTCAMLRLRWLTMTRNCLGSNMVMDLVKATHGPQNIPATRAERTMLMSSHIFRAMGPLLGLSSQL